MLNAPTRHTHRTHSFRLENLSRNNGHASERLFEAEPRQQVLIEVILRKRIFLVPLVAEQFGGSVKSRSVHRVVQKVVDFLSVLFVETHGVGVVDEFCYDARLAAVIEHIGEYVLLVVVVAPSVNDIIANSLEQRARRVAFKFLDV